MTRRNQPSNRVARRPASTFASALMVLAGTAAASGAFLPGADVAYGVSQDNRLYTYNLNTHALSLRHTITGLQPGETIRGLDFKQDYNDQSTPTDLYMLGSTGTIYLLDYSPQLNTYVTTPNGETSHFTVTGDSIGFDANANWNGRVPFFYASSTNGACFASGPPGYGSITSIPHYADGSPALIGGLASFADSVHTAPLWGLIGIDVARQQFVNVDPHHPPNGFGGPTLGLVTPLTTFQGPAGAMDLGAMVGFDMQSYFRVDQDFHFEGATYGLLALNETGSPFTTLYAMESAAFNPFTQPATFFKVGDVTLADGTPIRFTATAFIPTPGASGLALVGGCIVLRRRRAL